MTAPPFGNWPESTHKHTHGDLFSGLICSRLCQALDSECAKQRLWSFCRSINNGVHRIT